jgi:hypothetical protein
MEKISYRLVNFDKSVVKLGTSFPTIESVKIKGEKVLNSNEKPIIFTILQLEKRGFM